MLNTNNLKKTVATLIQGLPFIIICGVAAFFVAKAYISYTPSTYQSSAKIKLDDQVTGVSNNNLFKDFDHFSTLNKVEAEVELIKSGLIIKQALQKTEGQITIAEIGRYQNKVLDDSEWPFSLEFNAESFFLYDEPFQVRILNDSMYQVQLVNKTYSCFFDSTHLINNSTFSLNQPMLEKSIVGNDYELEIASMEQLVTKIKERLFVKQVDKDVAVIQLYYKDRNAQRSAKFLNALCSAFIEDHIAHRTNAARTTTEFIDRQLVEIGKELKSTENEIERYKLKNNIVNTRQESETGLRKLADLKVQLINLEMNKEAIERLDDQIRSGDYFSETAISIGFGDLVIAELMKNLKLLSDERDNLAQKYTPEHEKIISQDEKIEKVKVYVLNAIQAARKDVETKTKSIEIALAEEDKEFDNFPTKVKNLQILEREFKLNENLFMFLTQKRNESAIASAAEISFHRIIELATSPKLPYSPNHVLITFAAVTMGLLMATLFVFLIASLKTKIGSKEDLEKHTTLPILGTIKKLKKGNENLQDVGLLANSLINHKSFNESNLIVVSSALREEGKTTVVKNLAEVLSRMNYKVLLVDADLKNPSLHKAYAINSNCGFTELVLNKELNLNPVSINQNLDLLCSEKSNDDAYQVLGNKNLALRLKEMKAKYEVVLFDTSATAISNDALGLMNAADLNLTVLRYGKTKMDYALNAEFISRDLDKDNFHYVLNMVPASTNYSGNYVSSRLNYNEELSLLTRFFNRVKAYYA